MAAVEKQRQKRRESVRNNVKQYRQRKEIQPFIDETGNLDIVAYFNSPGMKLKIAGMVDDALGGSRVNSQFLKWLSQIMGIYTEKREESVKFELTVADRQRQYQDFIEWGRRESEATGLCPMCRQPKLSGTELRLDTKPEHEDS